MPRLLRFLPLLLALVVLSCGGSDNKGSSSSSGGATATPTGPSVTDILTRSAAAAKAAKSFHFSLKHSGDGSLPMPLNLRLVSAEGDYVAPDRIKAGVKTKAAGANISVDVIGVGDKTWITNPFTRKWTSLPGTSVADIADPTVIVGTLLNGLKDPKIAGTDDVDGVKTYHVTGTMDTGALVAAFGDAAKPGKTVGVDLWIGQDDMLPRRGKVTGQLSDEDAKDVTRTVDLTKFGAPIDIKAPE